METSQQVSESGWQSHKWGRQQEKTQPDESRGKTKHCNNNENVLCTHNVSSALDFDCNSARQFHTHTRTRGNSPSNGSKALGIRRWARRLVTVRLGTSDVHGWSHVSFSVFVVTAIILLTIVTVFIIIIIIIIIIITIIIVIVVVAITVIIIIIVVVAVIPIIIITELRVQPCEDKGRFQRGRIQVHQDGRVTSFELDVCVCLCVRDKRK